MIASNAVMLRAQMVVCRAVKSFPFAIRAALPVDPSDPPDVRCWLMQTFSTAKPGRFRGPPAAMVRQFRWTILDTARRARRKLPRGRDDRILQLPEEAALDGVADPPPWNREFKNALENLAAGAAAAARSMVFAGAPGLRRRKALAVLACLARTVAAVWADEGTAASADLVGQLLSDPAFIMLPLGRARRVRFRKAMAILTSNAPTSPVGARINLQHALRAVGEPWAQSRHWREFERAFDQQRRLRSTRPSS